MPDFPTRADLYAIGRDFMVQRAKKLDPKTGDVEGSDANLFAGSQSMVGKKIVDQLALRIAALFLDSAEDTDLDRLAYERYRQIRKGASSALGTVRFFRASCAPGAGPFPTG